MHVYRITRKQFLAISLADAWEFFSQAGNLQSITPPDMNFSITNSPGDKIFGGQIITYNLTPLLSIPITWVTEISHVQRHRYFIDEQRFGPFKLWHHQHHFSEVDGGIEMVDIVHYSLPFSFLGRIVHSVTVRKRLNHIFDYRYQLLESMFNKAN